MKWALVYMHAWELTFLISIPLTVWMRRRRGNDMGWDERPVVMAVFLGAFVALSIFM